MIFSDQGGGNTRTPPESLCSESMISDQNDPLLSDEPPTKKIKTSDISPAPLWTFTWFNFPETWKTHLTSRQGQLCGYMGGIETCPTTEKLHIQGWIEFPGKSRPSTLKLPKEIHWERMKKSETTNYKYCSKEDKDAIVWGTCEKAAPYEIDIDISPWMEELLNILEQPPDSRSIYWVWEPKGKAGKTHFQKWYELQHKGDTLILSGKASDMKHGIVQFKEQNKYVPRVVMCNVPRSTEEKFISWQGMEEIKDMLFYSGKYEGGMINDKNPHFVMFANWLPDVSHMSGDRWNLCRIPDGKGDGIVKWHNWSGDPDNDTAPYL